MVLAIVFIVLLLSSGPSYGRCGSDHSTLRCCVPSAFITKNAHLGLDGYRWKAIRRLSGDQPSRPSSSRERVSLLCPLPSAS